MTDISTPTELIRNAVSENYNDENEAMRGKILYGNFVEVRSLFCYPFNYFYSVHKETLGVHIL